MAGCYCVKMYDGSWRDIGQNPPEIVRQLGHSQRLFKYRDCLTLFISQYSQCSVSDSTNELRIWYIFQATYGSEKGWDFGPSSPYLYYKESTTNIPNWYFEQKIGFVISAIGYFWFSWINSDGETKLYLFKNRPIWAGWAYYATEKTVSLDSKELAISFDEGESWSKKVNTFGGTHTKIVGGADSIGVLWIFGWKIPEGEEKGSISALEFLISRDNGETWKNPDGSSTPKSTGITMEKQPVGLVLDDPSGRIWISYVGTDNDPKLVYTDDRGQSWSELEVDLE